MSVSSHQPEGGAVINRPFYLHIGEVPVFASASLPADRSGRSTAIIFCPTLALPEHMSYRVRHDWAEDLARHGYPALRFDLQGYGDSGDHAPDADGLELWIDAVRGGADWLRATTRCTRIVALGLGFGGLLAWASISRGAAIDDLVLWGTPTRGSRLLREIHASATVLIDARSSLASASDDDQTKDSGLPPGAVMDDAGQVIHKATADAVSALDLTTLTIPEASSRRVLLFERPSDERLRSQIEATGAEVTVRRGEGYDEMMQYVQFSRLPAGASEDLLRWLRDSPTSPAASAGDGSRPTPETSESIEFDYNGRAVRETLISMEVGGDILRGVLAEPVAGADTDLTGVFFSAGSDRRIGQNRIWVGAARRWAALGTRSIRFDPPGVGDSDGVCEDNGTLRGRYFDSVVDHTKPILDGIASLGVPDRFMLAGVCSGGWRAVRAALIDERIAGVYAVDFPFFRWNWWIIHLRTSWIEARKPRLDEATSRRFALQAIKATMRAAQPARQVLINSKLRSRRNLLALTQLRAQKTQLTCLFRDSSEQLEEMMGDLRKAQKASNASQDSVTVHVAPGFDPQYRPIAIQAHLNSTLDDALLRVRGRRSESDSVSARAPSHAC